MPKLHHFASLMLVRMRPTCDMIQSQTHADTSHVMRIRSPDWLVIRRLEWVSSTFCVVGGCHDNTQTVAVQAFLKTLYPRHKNSCVDTNDPHGNSNLYCLKPAEISKVKVRNKSRGNFDLNIKRLWRGTRVGRVQRQISLNHTAKHNLSACLCAFSFSFRYGTAVCWLQGYDSMSQTEYWFTIWLVYK